MAARCSGVTSTWLEVRGGAATVVDPEPVTCVEPSATTILLPLNSPRRRTLLPGFTLGWFVVAGMMRLLRSGMLEVLDSEYVKLARVKGVSERWVGRHRRAAVADVLVRCDDHRHLRSEPHAFAHDRLRRVVGHVGIEGSERRHRSTQHIHRMRIFCNFNQFVDLRRQLARSFQVGFKASEFLLTG